MAQVTINWQERRSRRAVINLDDDLPMAVEAGALEAAMKAALRVGDEVDLTDFSVLWGEVEEMGEEETDNFDHTFDGQIVSSVEIVLGK